MSKVEITTLEEDRYAQLQSFALDCAREGNTVELEKMIAHGMPVNLCTHKDDTLLMLAAYNGCLDTVSMLITKGANIDQKNQRGQTPLEGVCFKGNMPMVQLLVENAASIDKNAIIYATIFGHKDIVNYIMAQGVDTNRSRIFGKLMTVLATVTSQIKTIFKSRERNV